TPELAEALKLPNQSGALVSEVQPKSPAAEVGIQEGDVIVEFNGQKVTDSRALRLMVSQTEPKSKVTLKLLHEGKPRSANVTLDELHPEQMANREGGGGGGGRENTPAHNEKVLDGVGVTDL